MAAGERIASFDGHDGGSRFATFSPTGTTVLVHRHGRPCASGTPTRRAAVEPTRGSATAGCPPPRRARARQRHGDEPNTASLIDTRARGEIGAVDTCPGYVAADSLRIAGGAGRVPHRLRRRLAAPPRTWSTCRRPAAVHAARAPGAGAGVSPDGTRFVRQEGDGTMHGPLVVRDLRSGAEIVELDGLCTWDASSPLPPDQQAGCATYPRAAVRDLGAAAEVVAGRHDDRRRRRHHRRGVGRRRPDRCCTPTNRTLPRLGRHRRDLLPGLGAAARRHRTTRTSASSRPRTWDVVATQASAATQSGSSATHRTARSCSPPTQFMANTGRLAALVRRRRPASWRSPRTTSTRLAPLGGAQPRRHAHRHRRLRRAASASGTAPPSTSSTRSRSATRRSKASPSSTTSTSPSPPSTATCCSSPSTPTSCSTSSARSLTRGFTASECARFGFGDDCPTLAELRGRPDGADDPAVLNGTYEVRWTADHSRPHSPRPLAEASPAEQRRHLPRHLHPHLRRRPVRHRPRRDRAFCTGSYAVVGDRVRMVAERTRLAARMPPRPVPRRDVRAHRRRADVQRRHRPPRRRRALRQPALARASRE